jgi:hypothetical protein
VTVTARDVFNNLKASCRGTVYLTSSDPQATWPADYTFRAADHGVPTFRAILLRTAGPQTVSAKCLFGKISRKI